MATPELKAGLEFTSETTVDKTNTASTLGSGDMDVFATPAMVALMENAAMTCVADCLPSGSATVGTAIDVSHIKATGPGEKVSATARLLSVESRKLVFGVSACDSTGPIGEGTHIRYIVDREKFLGKLK
ncbi:MAG: thioesterase family protein [Alistipes sp.]|nr:thioesterase family protein [Alistipes sp.]